MSSFRVGILQPTSLTLLSGLAIIVAATLALGSMAQDQSGQSAATVSKSFRAEMRASDNEFTLIPIVCEAAQDSAMTEPRLPGRLPLSFGQVKDNIDPARDFANMLSELERIAGHCKVDAPVREVRIDVVDADLRSVTSIINQACDASDAADSMFLRDRMEAEIQTWAASPTPTAWIAAIREANRLRDETRREFSVADTPQFSIGASAALWPHADHVRPAMTIVLRFPSIESSVPQRNSQGVTSGSAGTPQR